MPLGRWIDPEAVHPLFADEEYAFWLDAGPDAAAGWSLIGRGVRATADEVRSVPVARDAVPDHPAGPLREGWIGWMSYEAGARAAGAPVAADAAPDQRWMRITELVAFDHVGGRVWAGGDDPRALARRLEDSPLPRPAVPLGDRGLRARARVTAAAYADGIRSCIEAIGRGDAYLLCLTTRFDVDGDVEPAAVHAGLRASSPSHHGALIRTGDTSLVSASPERFLHGIDGRVRTHPIKGTRPRGATAADDERLARELAADPKERAENVMIVDLMRNDLARVCDPASVSVDRLLEVETYPAVHQLVSTVSGRAVQGTTLGDLWDAAFPAGSMTGAPKLSAMTLLHGWEQLPRGAFSGCFGWVGTDGRFDLAMTIRTVVTHPGGASVSAGGGITWSSRVAAEVAEVALKASAPLRALGASLPADW